MLRYVAASGVAVSAAAGAWGAWSAARHEGAGERRGLLAVLGERGLKPHEGPVTRRQADRVDRQVVHETGVAHMLGIAAAAHAR